MNEQTKNYLQKILIIFLTIQGLGIIGLFFAIHPIMLLTFEKVSLFYTINTMIFLMKKSFFIWIPISIVSTLLLPYIIKTVKEISEKKFWENPEEKSKKEN